jgi:hypothetical protein
MNVCDFSLLIEQAKSGTFERYLGQQARRTWNSFIDATHIRLLRAPETARQIAMDASAVVRSQDGEHSKPDSGSGKTSSE